MKKSISVEGVEVELSSPASGRVGFVFALIVIFSVMLFFFIPMLVFATKEAFRFWGAWGLLLTPMHI